MRCAKSAQRSGETRVCKSKHQKLWVLERFCGLDEQDHHHHPHYHHRHHWTHAFIGQRRWLERCLAQAGIPSEDWIRSAQNRTQWRAQIRAAFPDRVFTPQELSVLDTWRPGTPLPDHSPPEPRLLAQHVDEPGRCKCWVCPMSFEHGNATQVHYENCHASCNPMLTTTPAFQRDHCLTWFPKLDLCTHHVCPAREPLERLVHVVYSGEPPVEAIGLHAIPVFRRIFVFGFATPNGLGWAATVYDEPPQRPVVPDYVLFGPVVQHAWDPNFLGMEIATPYVGELAAVAGACLWLLDNATERDMSGQPVGVEIHYTSELVRYVLLNLLVTKRWLFELLI